MLLVKNLNKNFGAIKALDNVSFELKKGRVTLLLGENGAGKSTLLRLLSGYLEPETGDIVLEHVSLEKQRTEYLKKIGYIPEISTMYGELKTFEFLQFIANLRQISQKETEEKIKKLIQLLELEKVICQRLDTLSKGYKKRVELATVLLSEPELVLLDEPTEGLDPLQKETIRRIIKKYAQKHIVLISTHALEDVEAMASDVMIIHGGKLEAKESFENLKNNNSKKWLEIFKKFKEER